MIVKTSFFVLLLIVLPSILAFVCGLVALVRINRSGGRLRGRTLAIIAIVVSALILLSLPLLFFMFLMPVRAASHKVFDLRVPATCQVQIGGPAVPPQTIRQMQDEIQQSAQQIQDEAMRMQQGLKPQAPDNGNTPPPPKKGETSEF